MKITLLGGSGFIGQHLARELVKRQHSLFIPLRNRHRGVHPLTSLAKTEIFDYDAKALAKLEKGFAGADAVVNLVGILNQNRHNSFDFVHGEFVRMLVERCSKHKVPRLLQISALGAATDAPSDYLRSKAKGEQFIRDSQVNYTILRPSVVFGANDSFINRFAGMIKYFPVMPLPMAAAQFQPIFVKDLVRLIVTVLEDDNHHNCVLHAGGLEVFTLQQIIYHIAEAMQRSRLLIPLGPKFSYAFAAMVEKFPGLHLIARDNCRSMQLPSVCPPDGNDAAKICSPLTAFDDVLQQLFKPTTVA